MSQPSINKPYTFTNNVETADANKVNSNFDIVYAGHNNVVTEVNLASGSKSTINDRLSITLNDDGTPKSGTLTYGGQWITSGLTPVYISATQFKVLGNHTDVFLVKRRVKITLSASVVYSSVSVVSYNGGTNYTTVTLIDSILTDPITTVEYSIFTPVDSNNSAISVDMLRESGAIVTNITGNVTGNLTGNVTGDVTGNITGNVAGNVTGNITGNVTGNVTGNISGTTGQFSGQITSTVSTGTAPLVVASTTKVANLYVERAVTADVGGYTGSQFFTSSGTFTVPAGITRIYCKLWGGGGAGGTVYAGAAASGGGGGGYTEGFLTVTPGANITVTVGAKGLGSATYGNATAGTASSISSLSAGGGGRAIFDNGQQQVGVGGTGTLNGANGIYGGLTNSAAGFGGSSPFGGAGGIGGGSGGVGGGVGSFPGGAGGGAISDGVAGGDGANGLVIVYW